MFVDSILPHAECGPNDHRKDAPPFIICRNVGDGCLYLQIIVDEAASMLMTDVGDEMC